MTVKTKPPPQFLDLRIKTYLQKMGPLLISSEALWYIYILMRLICFFLFIVFFFFFFFFFARFIRKQIPCHSRICNIIIMMYNFLWTKICILLDCYHSLLNHHKYIWAATWPNHQNDCAPSEDSDQPGHPPSLIRVFAVRMKKAWILSYPLSAHRRLWSDWADAQADLNLRWASSHFVGFVMSWLIFDCLSVCHFGSCYLYDTVLPSSSRRYGKKFCVPVLSNHLPIIFLGYQNRVVAVSLLGDAVKTHNMEAWVFPNARTPVGSLPVKIMPNDLRTASFAFSFVLSIFIRSYFILLTMETLRTSFCSFWVIYAILTVPFDRSLFIWEKVKCTWETKINIKPCLISL